MEKIDNYNLKINKIINNYGLLLLRKSNIVGVGRGKKIINGYMTNQPALIFFVRKKLARNLINQGHIMPKFISGVTTDILEIGNNKVSKSCRYAFPSGILDENEPALGGGCLYTIHKKGEGERLDYATLTHAVTEKGKALNVYFLASRHFLDPNNDFKRGQEVYYSKVFRKINNMQELLQSTIYLGRTEKVSKYISISPEERIIKQSVDASLGLVGPNNIDTKRRIQSGLVGGKVLGIQLPVCGDICYRIGMATGYGEARVVAVNTIINNYVNNKKPEKGLDILENQITLESIHANTLPGDSGSLGVIKNTNRAFGMLNGGDSRLSYYSYIDSVFEDLGIEFLI